MKHLFLFFLLITLASTSCDDSRDELVEVNDYLYFNSFETKEELVGFELGSIVLDSPSNGGNQSIGISGGCIYPHTSVSLGPYTEDLFLIVEVDGKLDQLSGLSSANLSIFKPENPSQYWSYPVQHVHWTTYKSETIHLKKGETIVLSLNAGGIKPGYGIFDLLRVSDVK